MDNQALMARMVSRAKALTIKTTRQGRIRRSDPPTRHPGSKRPKHLVMAQRRAAAKRAKRARRVNRGR